MGWTSHMYIIVYTSDVQHCQATAVPQWTPRAPSIVRALLPGTQLLQQALHTMSTQRLTTNCYVSKISDPTLICLLSCVGNFSSSTSLTAALPRNRSMVIPGGSNPWCCCHFNAWEKRKNQPAQKLWRASNYCSLRPGQAWKNEVQRELSLPVTTISPCKHGRGFSARE